MIHPFSERRSISQKNRKIPKLLEKFEKFTTLGIDVEKYEACWFWRAKNRNTKPVKCSIKIKFWILFSYNKALVEKDKFCNLPLDCRTLLNIWMQRWLSLAGKIQVFKSLVTLKPVYLHGHKCFLFLKIFATSWKHYIKILYCSERNKN